MFDNDTDKTKNRARTRLVVGGFYKGNTKETYYPLDFVGKDENDRSYLLDVMRNHKYIIEVTGVNGAGWETPDEAAGSASVNMDYNVIDWNDSRDENIIIDGPDYLSVERRSVTLYKEAGSSKGLTMSTNVPVEKINMAFAQNEGTPVVNSNNVTIGTQNAHYKAELIFDENDTITNLQITALQPYDAGYASEILTLTVGRIEFSVTIRRVNSPETGWDNGGNEDIDF